MFGFFFLYKYSLSWDAISLSYSGFFYVFSLFRYFKKNVKGIKPLEYGAEIPELIQIAPSCGDL